MKTATRAASAQSNSFGTPIDGFRILNPVLPPCRDRAWDWAALAVALNVLCALLGAIFGATYAAASPDAGGLRPVDRFRSPGSGGRAVKDVRLIPQTVRESTSRETMGARPFGRP